jgi:hypothetical protein
VRQAARVTRLPRGDHRRRRAARALGVGPCRIEPQPQRDADRGGAGAEQRDGAVDAAAHRDGDAPRHRVRPDFGRNRVRERVGGERLARHRRGLEQRQALERPRQPRCVGSDDPVTVHRQPHEGELGSARRVPDELDHRSRLAARPLSPPDPRRRPTPTAGAQVLLGGGPTLQGSSRDRNLPSQVPILRNQKRPTLPMVPCADANLVEPGGCRAGRRRVRSRPDPGSLHVSVGSRLRARPTHRVEHA